MDINDLIKKALNDVGLPVFYIKRATNINECVVYNYIEAPNSYGDMQELSTKYTVLLNVYCKHNIENSKKKVVKAMLDSGFKKKIITPVQIEENNLYNMALQFNFAILNKK